MTSLIQIFRYLRWPTSLSVFESSNLATAPHWCPATLRAQKLRAEAMGRFQTPHGFTPVSRKKRFGSELVKMDTVPSLSFYFCCQRTWSELEVLHYHYTCLTLLTQSSYFGDFNSALVNRAAGGMIVGRDE